MMGRAVWALGALLLAGCAASPREAIPCTEICPEGAACIDGQCRFVCNDTGDCPVGRVCDNGVCRAGNPPGGDDNLGDTVGGDTFVAPGDDSRGDTRGGDLNTGDGNSGDSGPCALDMAASCGGFACTPGGAACRMSCSDSSHCVAGFGCDTSTSACSPDGVPAPGNSSIWADPTSLAAGTDATVWIELFDANDNPIVGQMAMFAATGTGNTITQPAVTTDMSGATLGTLNSSVQEMKTLSILFPSGLSTVTAPVTFTPGYQLEFSPTPLDFGQTNADLVQLVTLTNNGTATSAPITVSLDDTNLPAAFGLETLMGGDCMPGQTLGVGMSCTVPVRFLGEGVGTAGIYSASVEITTTHGTVAILPMQGEAAYTFELVNNFVIARSAANCALEMMNPAGQPCTQFAQTQYHSVQDAPMGVQYQLVSGADANCSATPMTPEFYTAPPLGSRFIRPCNGTNMGLQIQGAAGNRCLTIDTPIIWADDDGGDDGSCQTEISAGVPVGCIARWYACTGSP